MANKNKADLAALTSEYREKATALTASIAANTAAIEASKAELAGKIDAVRTTHEAEVGDIRSLIDTLKAADTASEARIAALEAQVAALLAIPRYSVIFDVAGGIGNVLPQSALHGEKLERPADPSRENYEFLGWYIGDEKWSFAGHVVTADMTLTARWGAAYRYQLDAMGNAMILSYDGNKTEVTVPVEVDGHLVTAIANGAFAAKGDIVSLVLPDSILVIEPGALGGLSSLRSLSVPFLGTDAEHADVLGSMFGRERFSRSVETDQNSTEYYLPRELSCVTVRGGALSSYAFQNCIMLENVHLPDHITEIGEYAFSGCASLVALVIPDSVTSVGCGALRGCDSLVSLDIPFLGASRAATAYEATLGYIFGYTTKVAGGGTQHQSSSSSTFVNSMAATAPEGTVWQYSCYNYKTSSANGTSYYLRSYYYYIPASLKSVTVTDAVKVSSAAFNGCEDLTVIVLDEGIQTIGEYAFGGCRGLHEIILPQGVKTVSANAFSGCTDLTSVVIPDSVTSIGESAFSGCTALASVCITDITVWCKISFGDSTANPLYYAGNLCLNGELVTELIIPDSVTSIGSYAFYGCTGLTSVAISDSVTSIGSAAFGGCSSLETLAIPFVGGSKTATSASSSTLFGYIFGTSSYEGGVETEQYYATTSFATYYIPASLESVTVTGGNLLYGAFYNCSGLTSVVIPASVESIGERVFAGCSKLTIYCEAPSKPSEWNSSWNPASRPVVWDCKNNQVASDGYLYVVIDGLRYGIKGDTATVAGQPSTITVANIPAMIEYDGKPYSVTSIGSAAFSGCSGLTSVVIPASVERIGSSAFSGCSGLTSVVIGDGVTSIGSSAFSGCSSLETLVIPFVGSSKAAASASSSTLFGYIFGTSSYEGGVETEQYYAPSSFATYYIPASLKSVTVTGGNLLYGAFYNCSGLTSVVIGGSVTSIGSAAFRGCSGLTSVVIGDGVTSIGSSAFKDCSGLTSVVIPDSVTSIGSYAFEGCSKLTIYTEWLGKPSGWNSNWNSASRPVVWGITDHGVTEDGFAWISKGNTVTVIGYVGSATELTIPEAVNGMAVTGIGERAFYSCSGLTSVVIGGSVTSIGDYAFAYRSRLASVVIGDSVESIGSHAFYSCSGLTSVVIPDSVTSIGTYAFSGCSKLTIYCEATSKPSGWNSSWNYSSRPVEWGYTGK